ncbi:hypothetical protein BXZ70DRAFT_889300 [Cristinia sonorae]|uniref:Ketoreductase (KR) domain-containing protein n=1 Tax=Cristinia sonorae TaxID=1940300 RepID=A0A8K0UT35_9AGAR|nr:hypothetical protein BXZ70DRAFT_889300 [Cristinia sonorae]
MVLGAAYELSTRILPPEYYTHAAITTIAGIVTYAFAQGRTTNRERNLHARIILVTGGFTPLGLTLITSLASRGAHIIALSDYPLTENSIPSLLIPVLRAATKNEQIYAEYADLSSSESIRAFCTKFLTGEDHRLDAIVFAHEYRGIGTLFRRESQENTEWRDVASLATFLITTLLLPKLLVAPIERDIRIVNVINPFYAASAPLFPSKLTTILTSGNTHRQNDPLFLAEGFRALRTAIFTRHLQRVLNALPNGAPGPDESKNKPPGPQLIKPPKMSNIIAVTAAPGISRVETISPMFGADRESGAESFSLFGMLLYMFLYPVIFLLAKSSKTAEQSILHVLFLPTPFKRALAQVNSVADGSAPASAATPSPESYAYEEVLKPGGLYRECAVVNLKVPSLPPPPESAKPKDEKRGKGKGKQEDEFVVIEDDGEFGGESLGRMVWEWYETRLKDWETKDKARVEALKKEAERQKAAEGKQKLASTHTDSGTSTL